MGKIFKIMIIFLIFTASSYSDTCKAEGKVLGDISISCNNGVYGIKKTDKIIIPEKFKKMHIEVIQNNLIYIRPKEYTKGNRPFCYLINTAGEILYRSQFFVLEKSPFHKLWTLRDEYGFEDGSSSNILMDKKGNFLSEKYSWIKLPREDDYYIHKYDKNYFVVGSKETAHKRGLIDFKGKEIIEPLYDDVEEIDREHIIAYKDGYAGLLNSKQEIIIPFGKYTKIRNDLKGTGKILVKINEDSFIIDKETQKVLYSLEKGDYVKEFIEGVWAIYGRDVKKLLDKDLNEIMDVKKYDSVMPVLRKIIKVRKDYKSGYMNKENKVLIPMKYNRIDRFKNEDSFLISIIKNSASVHRGGWAAYKAQMGDWRDNKYDTYIFLDEAEPRFLDEINDVLKDKAQKKYIFDIKGNVFDVSNYSAVKITIDKKIKVKKSLISSWKDINIKNDK